MWLFLHYGVPRRGQQDREHAHRGRAAAGSAGIKLADRDLAYLEEGTESFDGYIGEMRWAQRFARLNREEMMDRVRRRRSGGTSGRGSTARDVNCHHNYTTARHISGARCGCPARARSPRGRGWTD